jgi:hypothetical protein
MTAWIMHQLQRMMVKQEQAEWPVSDHLLSDFQLNGDSQNIVSEHQKLRLLIIIVLCIHWFESLLSYLNHFNL